VVPQPAYLTRQGLTALKAELEELRTHRRQAVAERIQKAKEIGGTVDNAEYDEAKNEQAFIEGRILTLDNLINNAVIISEKAGPEGVVHIGSVVTVVNPDGKKGRYTIIGSAEADPAHGKISNVSPIGKALLGKRVGDVAEVNAPAGKLKLEVVEIR
jgi:transcription elongation factor GreA